MSTRMLAIGAMIPLGGKQRWRTAPEDWTATVGSVREGRATDARGAAPFVSNKGYDGESEELIGCDFVWREIRKPHGKTSIWKLMGNLMIEDRPEESLKENPLVGGKRKADEPCDGDKVTAKRTKSMEELFGDWLAEWDDSADENTHSEKWMKMEDEELTKGGEEILLNCLFE